MASSREKYVFYFAAILFILAGGVFFFIYGRVFIRSIRSTTWPAVKGKISSSQWRYSGHADGRSWADIRYNYKVAGKSYNGHYWTFRLIGSDNEALSRYRKGKTVDVYYSPTNPALAVLEPGIAYFSVVVALVFVVPFVSSGLFLVYLGNHRPE